MRVIAILMIIGHPTIDEGPLEEEGIKIGVEGHQIEGIIMIETTLIEEEDPLMEMEDPLMEEDPLIEKDPLMMEDPLGMDEIQDALEDKDHQVHQDLLDQ